HLGDAPAGVDSRAVDGLIRAAVGRCSDHLRFGRRSWAGLRIPKPIGETVLQIAGEPLGRQLGPLDDVRIWRDEDLFGRNGHICVSLVPDSILCSAIYDSVRTFAEHTLPSLLTAYKSQTLTPLIRCAYRCPE